MNLFSFNSGSKHDIHMNSDYEDQPMTEMETDGDPESDFDNDSDSVASYATAPEDQDQYDSSDEEGRAWSELVQKYGAKRSAPVDAEIETFNLLIGTMSRAKPVVTNQKKIEEFSGAKLTFLDCPKPYLLGLRIEGCVEQAHFAVQACNALIEDYQHKHKKVYVTLKVQGPQFLSSVAALRKGLQQLLPQDNFVKDEQLHITVAFINIWDKSQFEVLIQRVEHMAKLLSEAYEVEPMMIGHLGRIGSCKSGYISIVPMEADDPLNTIVYTMRQLLQKDYKFSLIRGSEPHMTIFTCLDIRSGPSDFNRAAVDELCLSPDLGRVVVSEIQVSRRIPSLGGARFDTIASFPIDSSAAAKNLL